MLEYILIAKAVFFCVCALAYKCNEKRLIRNHRDMLLEVRRKQSEIYFREREKTQAFTYVEMK
jgi:hypothetical protein